MGAQCRHLTPSSRILPLAGWQSAKRTSVLTATAFSRTQRTYSSNQAGPNSHRVNMDFPVFPVTQVRYVMMNGVTSMCGLCQAAEITFSRKKDRGWWGGCQCSTAHYAYACSLPFRGQTPNSASGVSKTWCTVVEECQCSNRRRW